MKLVNKIVAVILIAVPFSAFAFNAGSVSAVDGTGQTSSSELKSLQDLSDEGSISASDEAEIRGRNELLGQAANKDLPDSTAERIAELFKVLQTLNGMSEDHPDYVAKSAEADSLKSQIQSEVASAQARQAATEFYSQLQGLDRDDQLDALDTPQEQDPDNPFYITASHTTRVWNRGIQLSAYGGMNGTVSYHMSGGDCQVTVEGLVISPGRPAACTIYAKRTASAGFFQQSDPITVNFTLECPEEGQALSASASATSANVGESVTISASGGGCYGVVQYFEASPNCNVSGSGVVTGTRVGDCPVTVTKSSEGSINPSQQQIVTISFVDPNEGGTLSLSANNVSPAVNETANLIVSGGIGEPLFGVRGNGCSVNSNGTVSGSGQPRTCEAYVNKGSQTASVCINFGGGGPNPPVGCAPDGSLDGPLVIQAPTGPVSMTETTTVDGDPAYFGSYQLTTTGGGTGTLRFESYNSPVGCTVSQNGNVTASTTQTGLTCTATARRFGGPEGTVLSQNSVTIVFGDADAADGGSQEFQPLVISSSAGLSANVGDSLQLSFTGGRSGNPIFGNAASPTGCSITTDGQVTRATEGVCHVSAYDDPDTSNALCIAFGDLTITDATACTAQAATAPTIAFTASATTVGAPGSVTVTASLNRALKAGESIEIYPETVGGVDPLAGGLCLVGGNQLVSFIEGQSRDSHARAFTCTQDLTVLYKAVVEWPGGTVEETLCVRYGNGSINSECPGLSGSPEPEVTEDDGGEMTLEASAASAAVGERITFTATNAGDTARWIINHYVPSAWNPATLPSNTCQRFSTDDPNSIEVTVTLYNAICEVTLVHDDDDDNRIEQCVRFGDITDSQLNAYCP